MKVTILSRAEALRYIPKSVEAAIISITDVGAQPANFTRDHYKFSLRMQFDDCLESDRNLVAMSQEQANDAAVFIRACEKREIAELVIHCEAGLSRSAGLAAAACRVLSIDDHECYGNGRFPNVHVIRSVTRAAWDLEEQQSMSSVRAFAGVGSRNTPPEILLQETAIAKRLTGAGFVLYSGGAQGSDSAFERGAGDQIAIFYAAIKHKTPSGYAPIPTGPGRILVEDGPLAAKAEKLVQQVLDPSHWRNIVAKGDFVKNLHRRNAFQILGPDLASPVEFVVLYAPKDERDNTVTGGTKTAHKLASRLGIPIYNLIDAQDRERLSQFLAAGYPQRTFKALCKTREALDAMLPGASIRHSFARKIDVERKQPIRNEPAIHEISVGNDNRGDRGEYIGRGGRNHYPASPLANPFRIGAEHNGETLARGETLPLYKAWLKDQIRSNQPTVMTELRRLAEIAQKAPLTLVCHCAPAACHGEIVRDAIVWFSGQERARRPSPPLQTPELASSKEASPSKEAVVSNEYETLIEPATEIEITPGSNGTIASRPEVNPRLRLVSFDFHSENGTNQRVIARNDIYEVAAGLQQGDRITVQGEIAERPMPGGGFVRAIQADTITVARNLSRARSEELMLEAKRA